MGVSSENETLLRDAVTRCAPIVLSLPSGGVLRHHRSRFLAEDPDGLWIESVSGEHNFMDELIGLQQPIAISFKSGTLTVSLASPIRRREPRLPVNADSFVEAILVAFPDHVKSSQRRTNYRVRVTPEDQLITRIWRIADHTYLGDRPVSAQEIKCELRDLSLGGMGVRLSSKDGQPPKVTGGDRLRIELSHGDVALLLDGRVRHPTGQAAAPIIPAGIAFKPLDQDIQGRHQLALLTRIIGELQRSEVKRTRRGA